MRSLNTRVLVAAGLALAAFLSAAGIALDQAFRDTALASVRERLTGRVYLVLGMVDLDFSAPSTHSSAPPDPLLSTPESGHYAQILNQANERVWNSRSMLGITIDGPRERAVGQYNFASARSSTDEALFVLSYTVLWEGATSPPSVYTVQVAENERAYDAQINRFRKSLWFGFLSIGFVLLLVQTIIFRWSLKPLRDVAIEVNRIERGEQTKISGQYPLELHPLTNNLNTLIRTNQASVSRLSQCLGGSRPQLEDAAGIPTARAWRVRRSQIKQGSLCTARYGNWTPRSTTNCSAPLLPDAPPSVPAST